MEWSYKLLSLALRQMCLGSYVIRGWLRPRAGLVCVEKRKPYNAGNKSHVIYPVACRYTD
jgi:hypothetical protein